MTPCMEIKFELAVNSSVSEILNLKTLDRYAGT